MVFQKKWIPFLVIGMVLGVVIGIVLKSGLFFSDTARKKVIEDPSFSKIDVSTSNAIIEIIPTKNNKTVVEYSGKDGMGKNYRFDVKEKGGTLVVELKKKGWSFFNFNFSRQALRLTVEVPDKHYSLIQAKSDNGKIRAENLQTDELVLQTDNGRIELNHIEASKIHVKSDNGRIDLQQVNGEIIGKTDNGGITLLTDHLDQSIDLSTDNGRIEIQTLNEPTNATIDADTDNGKISVFGKENKQMTFGNGEHTIKLKSDNGRITITK